MPRGYRKCLNCPWFGVWRPQTGEPSTSFPVALVASVPSQRACMTFPWPGSRMLARQKYKLTQPDAEQTLLHCCNVP